jgi:hypothetical protein
MFKKFLSEHSLSEYTFRDDLFPTVEDRAFWENFPNDTCIAEAEAALDYAWPVIKATDFMAYKQTGDRVIMENPHFDRRNHLVLFALAELKENKGRFLPQITNGLFAICEETFWGLSAHMPHHTYTLEDIPMPNEAYIDLFAAETAEHLASISRLLEKPLAAFCPRILERVDEELERRIRVPYPQRRDFVWMGYVKKNVNNWNPWIISNLLTVYLLTDKNTARVRRAVEKMMVELQVYYDCVPADGGCDEGPGYWQRAGASLFECLYQLKCATNGALDLFADEKIGRIAAYMKSVHIAADYFVNVADAHAKGLGVYMPLLYGFARETKQPDLANFSVAAYCEQTCEQSPTEHTNRTLRRLIYNAQFLKEMQHHTPHFPLHGAVEYLPDLQLAVLRRGEMSLSAKGGHNKESHNHNDVGSFALYEGVTPVLVDVGIDTYTRDHFSSRRYIKVRWVRSAYHNLPLINGAEQKNGREFCAKRFAVSEEGLDVSFAAAYPCEAEVSEVTRALRWTANGVRICDRFVFTGERKRVCEVLMSILPVREEADAVIIGGRYRITAKGAKISTEQVLFEDKRRLEDDWKTDRVTRILFDFEGAEEICIKVEKI